MAPPQSMDPGIVPQLQNIVSTVSLGCKLDLKKIALSARNAEYNPKRFAAVIMRIREPRTTALIFRFVWSKIVPNCIAYYMTFFKFLKGQNLLLKH